jgi:hypothetical protein
LCVLYHGKIGKGFQPFAIEESERKNREGEEKRGRPKGGNGIEIGKEGTGSMLEREGAAGHQIRRF